MIGRAAGPPARALYWLVLLTTLAVAGCTGAPPVGDTAFEVAHPPARYVAAPARPGALLANRWWRQFQNAELEALVDSALAANHDLAATVALVDAAAAQATIAGAELTPSLAVSVDAARRQQNFIGLPIPGGPEVLTSRSTSFGLSLVSSWELDVWGRVRAGRRAAVLGVEAALADAQAARLALAGRCTKAYFAAAEAAQQLGLARETHTNYQAATQWVEGRYARGLAAALDVRLARAAEAAAQAGVARWERGWEASRRQLEVLLGRYPNATLDVDANLAMALPPPPIAAPAALLARRPDLVAAERRLAAADARVAQAFWAQFPRLSLNGSAGTAVSRVEDLGDPNFKVWNVAGNLLAPLFQGGRLRAGLRLSRAQLEASAEGVAALLLRAYAEVENALAAERTLSVEVTALAEAAEQAAGARRLAESRYRAGLEPYFAVLEAQRQALTQASALLDARRRRLDARVDLCMALGGGST